MVIINFIFCLKLRILHFHMISVWRNRFQSPKFRYKILAVTDNNGNDVMEQNEFKINPKYRNRPMAYLRAAKTILYNEVSVQTFPGIILYMNFLQDGNQKRHITIEYFASDRRSGQVLYKELIHIHVFISKYDFWTRLLFLKLIPSLILFQRACLQFCK